MSAKKNSNSRTTASIEDGLIASLANQIKLPLLQIAHDAELMRYNKASVEETSDNISATSHAAIRLIDGYLLSLELQKESRMEFESLSASAVMYEAADQLRGFAAMLDCNLELEINGRPGPIIGRKQALLSALISLGQNFIESASQNSAGKKSTVKLLLRRLPMGLKAGIYSPQLNITKPSFERSRILSGNSLQPMAVTDSTSAAGIYIADRLLSQINIELKISRNKNLAGLGFMMKPSRQLSLV